MQDNRNSRCGLGFDTRGTVCISAKRVLDCCRDRDCFEDVRVYLTSFGEEVLQNATNIKTRSAKLIWACVSVDAVPFNRGFYRITVRYYVKVECEACVCMGKSQSFCGIAVLEKDVILYGGEGSVVSYSSSPGADCCCIGDINNASTNDPIAVVETAEPIVLSTKVMDCSCGCNPCCNDCCEIPESVCGSIDGELVSGSNNALRLYVSFGIFSVIRIEREAQLLIEATDYSVPDKECTAATNNDNPCSLFNTMPFPVSQFKTTMTPCVEQIQSNGCGCGNK